MINLRPLQVRAIKQIRETLTRHRRVICTAPTGFGKRVLMVWACIQGVEKGKRHMIVTDRQILVDQAADECRKHGVDFGLVMGDRPRNDAAPVQICSIATLKRREWKDVPHAHCVWIDESHKESSAYATLMDCLPAARVIGLTATPVGAEGRSLLGLFDRIIEPVKNTELIAGGWLLKTECWNPSSPDISGITVDGGKEYNQVRLGERIEEVTVFADVFEWFEKFRDSAICFVPRIKFANGIRDQFLERGVTAEVISSETHKRDRRPIFRDFESGDVEVLISVDVLKEGFDAPRARVMIDLQPNKQLRTYWQKVGRIKRPHPGQQHATLLDFAGNVWSHPHPDEDVDWDEITGNTSTGDWWEQKKKSEPNEKQPWACVKCGYTLCPGERMDAGKCPNCGNKAGSVKRRIRMQNGELKLIGVGAKKKTQKNREQQVWDRCRYIAHNSGRTLDFARVLYRKNTGQYPPRGLKCCPDDAYSSDWKERPADVYPWMVR